MLHGTNIWRSRAVALVLLVVVAVLGAPLVAAHADLPVGSDQDIAAPLVDSISVAPTSVDVRTSNATISFSAHVTDDLSGSETAQVFYRSPSGQQAIISNLVRSSGTALDGTFAGTYVADNTREAGTWTVVAINTRDAVGNTRSYTTTEARALGAVDIEILSDRDTTLPTLSGIRITPNPLNVSGADGFPTVEFDAADASGILQISMRLASPSDRQIGFATAHAGTLTSGTVNNGTFRANFSTSSNGTGDDHPGVPRYSEPGVWRVLFVQVYDSALNVHNYFPAELAPMLPNDFVVTSNPFDATMPGLSAFRVSPAAIDVTSAPQAVTVEFDVGDNLSGVRAAWLQFQSPSNAAATPPFLQHRVTSPVALNQPRLLNGTITGSVTFPVYDRSGNWKITELCVSDRVNWQRCYDDDEIGARGPKEIVVVANEPPVVTVTGVTNGGTYETGSVPTPACDVRDREDGTINGVAPITTGPDANGRYTVTCSYTDAGGKTGTATTTYTVTNANPPPSGSARIRIKKVTSPAGGSGFNFTGPTGSTSSSATVLPGGNTVIFSGLSSETPLSLLNVGSGAVTTLAGTEGGQNAEWSPDSKRIAYQSGIAVKVYELATGAITTVASSALYPTWSPDGQWIAYVSGTNEHIWAVASIGASAPFELTFGTGRDDHPAWSSDGRIAFRTNRSFARVWVGTFNPTTKALDGLAGMPNSTGVWSQQRPMQWSPDSSRLALGAAFDAASDDDIFMLNGNGTGTAQQLTTAAGDDSAPTWTPDGNRIVFFSTRTGGSDLYSMPANGSAAEQVFYAGPGAERDPDWGQPSGTPTSYVLNDGDTIGGLVDAGRSERFEEVAKTGWTLTGIDCGGNPHAVIQGASVTFTPAAGDDILCTFTNTQNRAHLTVIKNVVNDDRGSAAPSAFTMDVTASNPSTAHFPGADGAGTTIEVDPGPYSVDESGGPDRYTKTLGAGCSGTLAPGGSAVCTITNNDQPPELPVLAWADPDSIVYGTALGASELNATASTPGTFAYTPEAGTVLNVGDDQSLSVTFTPDDAVRYTTATMTVHIDVTKAPLTVTADDKTRPYGSAEPAFTASYTGFVLGQNLADSGVSGSPACATTATSTSIPGSYPIECTAGTLASSNYSFGFVPGNLTVTKVGTRLVARPATVIRSALTLKVTFSATLTSAATGAAIPGATIKFTQGGSTCSAVTNGAGVATCSVTILNVVYVLLGQSYSATYAGGAVYLPSAATGASTL